MQPADADVASVAPSTEDVGPSAGKTAGAGAGASQAGVTSMLFGTVNGQQAQLRLTPG
jgi:hypothetical protein